jgi:hypothetical protein
MKILRIHVLTVLLLSCSSILLAQTNNLVQGLILNKKTKEPIQEATITINELRIVTSTDANGKFSFVSKKVGTFEALITTDGFDENKVSFVIKEGNNTIPTLEFDVKDVTDVFLNDIAANGMADGAIGDDGVSGNQNVSSVLNAARDPFLSAATFGWGQYFFSLRGLESDQHVQYLNGIPMNDMETGRVSYNSYSGLNDVFRGRTLLLGAQPLSYGFGGYGLNSYIDASASAQRTQTRISYASTNRNYRNRMMLTHSSGLNKKGWAYSFSLSRRYANQGVVKGTFYDALGYFAAIEKKHKKHDISLMAVGAPLRRGKNGPATQEVFDLAGTNFYNPYWGYQNGEIRNSRVFSTHRPMFILSDKWQVSDKTLVNAAVSYQTGEEATSTLDWYNAPDPRPDYYRYLPSWEEIVRGNSTVADDLTQQIKANPEDFLQVNWDKLYEANEFNKQRGDGRAAYILGADVRQKRTVSANVNMQHFVNDHISLYAGGVFQNQRTQNYRRIEDLLGANYHLNINQFAERESQFQTNPNYIQLDLNNPNARNTVGDRYGYNYNMRIQNASFFTQAVFKYNRVDFFIAHELGNNQMQRDGKYKSGLYPNNSFGKSENINFNTYRTKAGITFKIDGRNYIYANGAVGTRAPFAEDVFISGRTRNQTIERPSVERIRSAEVGYLLRSPNFKTRVSGYVTEVKDASDIRRYFHDDNGSFTNMVLRGINRRSTGIEIGSEIKLSPSLSLNLAANIGQAFYTSNARFSQFDDNDTLLTAINQVVDDFDTAFIANYHVPKGPQTSFQANLFYRSPKYWFGSVTLNYMSGKWFDVAPTAKSLEGVATLDRDIYNVLIQQEEVQPYITLGAFAGKSFKLKKYFDKASNSMYLFVNLGLSNILNKQDIVLYGFENLRLGTVPDDYIPAFGNRQAYAFGAQYFLNIAFTF